MWDLSSPPRIKPAPPAVEVRSLNHWTAREVPESVFLYYFKLLDTSFAFSLFLFQH